MHSRLVTALVFAVGLLGVLLYISADVALRLSAERDTLRDDLTEARGQLDRARKGAAKATAEAQSARLKLKEALDADPTWRDTPVPVPVRDSLCERIRCTKPGSVSAPAG